MSERQAPQSFSMTAGETVFIEFTADGDITSAVVRLWLSRSRGGQVVVSTEAPLVNALATVTTSPQFTVSISDEVTETLVGDYVYEVELEDPAGNKTKAAHGFMSFKRQVA